MAERRIEVTEGPQVPWPSVVLAFGPMLLITAGAVATIVLAGPAQTLAARVTAVWAATILAFLAGVRRGLSFRTEGGARPAQMITMAGLFALAFASLVATLLTFERTAVATLVVGYLLAAVLDPLAARRGEAPLFFARLRPWQMMLGAASLAVVLVHGG